MSLIGTLNIGKSSLAVQQAAIQTTGNNVANAGNADYTRQVSKLSPSRDHRVQPGLFIGTGVDLTGIQRQIDEALEGRLRGSISDGEAADVTEQWMGRVEAVLNELGDQDLSTQLSTFFNGWSNLANKPQDIGLRQVVLQNGESLAGWMRHLRGQFSELQTDADGRLKGLVTDADRLAKQVADLNGQIVIAEGGAGGPSNGLRDQRDAALKQLSQLIDVHTVPQATGAVNVYIGSEPLVFDAQSMGLDLRQQVVDGQLTSTVIFKNNGGEAQFASGQLGALRDARLKIGTYVQDLDGLARNLIFELNKLHGSGQGLEGFGSVSSTNLVDDPAAVLNGDSGLASKPVNGSFVVHVRNKSSGLTTSTLVQVDLDGLNADDTTLNTLRADLDGIANVSANISGGRLTFSADSSDVEITFSQDTSGVLAALGINNFFTGEDARDIAVNNVLKDRPALLAAALNGEPADNQTARAIAGLETHAMAGLGGISLKDGYEAMVNSIAVAAAGAKNNAEAALVVRQTLEAQREALSGVSLDEEAVNLMRQQRGFQAASRLIAAVDELLETVLSLV